uniref:Uncharacterized protein n=1 Tax=Rhizophora mucronata TaxID=61149 RepID=A0A2P2NPG6_RHIMU
MMSGSSCLCWAEMDCADDLKKQIRKRSKRRGELLQWRHFFMVLA